MCEDNVSDLVPFSLPDFTQTAILVVGDVMLDRYWFGDTTRISPEAPIPIVNVHDTDNRPGGAANVALNVAALGAKTTLLGAAGQDEAATTLALQLTKAGITHTLMHTAESKTLIKLRVMSKHQQLLRLDFEEPVAETRDKTQEQQLTTCYETHLSNTHLVILSDYKKGTLSNPSTLIKLAKTRGIPVLVDPKGADFSIYRGATLITPNLKEFENVVGKCATEEMLINKARTLIEAHDIASILITRGEQGMTFVNAEETFSLKAHAKEVYDVTGAGDTVIAALGVTLAANMSLPATVSLANFAASLSVAKLGASVVTIDELKQALQATQQQNSTITDEDALEKQVDALRASGKKIIFTNGCFDILHIGHIEYLQRAKALGDYLIVAVNIDETVRAAKGKDRPINTLQDRMTVLSAIKYIDAIIAFSDPTPERLLQRFKPNILVKGDDYPKEGVVGWQIVESYGGEVRNVGAKLPHSSTAIIKQIRKTPVKEIEYE